MLSRAFDMILQSLEVDPVELASRTGWKVEERGACKGEACVPLDESAWSDGKLNVRLLAKRLGMPLVHEPAHGLWALGPECAVTGRVLTTAQAPELELPDLDDEPFRLSSLLGQKVVLLAWASY